MSRARRTAYVRDFEIGPDDVVVDVGCGPGAACLFAGKLGAEVIAIDCEPLAIHRLDEAMRSVPARSYRGIVCDSDPLPLTDGSATVVICTEVLEHVDDPPRVVAELARIGAPGARYLISVPDPASEDLMRIVAPAWYFRKPIHQHVYERGQLDGLLAAAGLEVESRDAGDFYWSMWWVFRMALGMEHPYVPAPDAPLLAHWDAAWKALDETPRGRQVAEALGRLLPKSQVLIARKAGRPASRGLIDGGFRRPMRLKRFLRDGAIRLGGYDLRWNVRRARPVARPSLSGAATEPESRAIPA